jgi:hypothetical protein
MDRGARPVMFCMKELFFSMRKTITLAVAAEVARKVF